MRKLFLIVFASLLLVLIYFLVPKEGSNAKAEASLTLQTDTVVEVYEYVYPNNTPNLIENQQIELIQSKSGLVGFFHGTSDLFDVAREGYLPGFFVLPMLHLKMGDDGLSFDLLPTPDDLFSQPIPLKYRASADVKRAGFEQWGNAQIMKEKSPMAFSAKRKGTSLIVKDASGAEMEFKKK